MHVLLRRPYTNRKLDTHIATLEIYIHKNSSRHFLHVLILLILVLVLLVFYSFHLDIARTLTLNNPIGITFEVVL